MSLLDGSGPGSRYDAGRTPSDGQLAAVERLRPLDRRLDRQTAELVEAVVVDDLRWRAIAARLGVHACTAKRRAIAVIKVLAAVWGWLTVGKILTVKG